MKIFARILTVVVLCLGVVSSVSWSNDKALKIVTTTGMLADAVVHVGGERVEIKSLMGPGVDPHLYKASESDVRKLASADVIIYNGLYLEAKMEDIFHKMARSQKVFAAAEAIPKEQLLDSVNYAGHFDPHVWFDVRLWTHVVDAVAKYLSETDPAGSSYYYDNAEQYTKELNQLHESVSTKADSLPENQRVLVTAHDAFRYFGRAYGFEVVGLQGLSTESEAGTRDVIDLANFIAERKINAIFVESSVPERNIKAVQEAVKSRGWNVAIGGELFSDAMGNEGAFEGTYIGMVTHNIDTIVHALGED